MTTTIDELTKLRAMLADKAVVLQEVARLRDEVATERRRYAFGLENEHSDGHHDDAPNPECAACRQEAAERRECRTPSAKPAKPGPGRLVRVREEDPTFDSWPTWDHPLGGPGRWAVVIRSLRSGVEAAPIVQGYTLPPRGLRAFQSLEDHRCEEHKRYENAVRSHKIACSSGLYTPTQLGEPPVYPAWLARALPDR